MSETQSFPVVLDGEHPFKGMVGDQALIKFGDKPAILVPLDELMTAMQCTCARCPIHKPQPDGNVTETPLTDLIAEGRCSTVSVEQAGRVLGLSRNGAYAAAARGDIPTIRIGRKLLVPTHRLAALLEGEKE